MQQLKEIVAFVFRIQAEDITDSGLIMGLAACAGLVLLAVCWCKDIFGGERELKPGEKYTYRTLPSNYALDKILEQAREEKDYRTEYIVVRKMHKLKIYRKDWTHLELFKLYYSGRGTRKNKIRALWHLKRAVAREYLPAYQEYGNYLVEKKKYDKAAEFLRKGLNEAHGGCAFALYKMMDAELAPPNKELAYKTERFLALFVAKVRNIPEAVEIYDGLDEHSRFTGKPIESFKLKLEIGILSLTALLRDDDNSDDCQKRVSAALEAALLGSAEMQYNYGVRLTKGIGISKNERLGVVFTLAAARQKYTKAMSWLGILYSTGVGVEENQWRAVEWFEEAIAEGDNDAYSLAGEAYRNLVIRGYTEYADRAIEVLEKAIELRDEESREYLYEVKQYLYEHDL